MKQGKWLVLGAFAFALLLLALSYGADVQSSPLQQGGDTPTPNFLQSSGWGGSFTYDGGAVAGTHFSGPASGPDDTSEIVAYSYYNSGANHHFTRLKFDFKYNGKPDATCDGYRTFTFLDLGYYDSGMFPHASYYSWSIDDAGDLYTGLINSHFAVSEGDWHEVDILWHGNSYYQINVDGVIRYYGQSSLWEYGDSAEQLAVGLIQDQYLCNDVFNAIDVYIDNLEWWYAATELFTPVPTVTATPPPTNTPAPTNTSTPTNTPTATPTPETCGCGQSYQAADWTNPDGPWECGSGAPGGWQTASRGGPPTPEPTPAPRSVLPYALGAGALIAGAAGGVVYYRRRHRRGA